MIEGRIRALDGGALARVCPLCGEIVEDEAVEVITSTVEIAGELVNGYSTEIGDANWKAHVEEHHGD